jgi:hypothetical protein
MVAQDHLSDAEILAVIAYIKSFSTRWANEKPGTAIAIVPPANLDGLASEGKELFKKSRLPRMPWRTGARRRPIGQDAHERRPAGAPR